MTAEPYPRVVPFREVFNFRDVGGYPAADGRTVRWRRLFRSDSLDPLQPDELGELRRLGLRTVVDLRDPAELHRRDRPLRIDGLRHHSHPTPLALGWQHYRPGADLDRFIADRYLALVEKSGPRFAAAVATLAADDALPAVLHCQVGRDRTGVLVALVLALLGVDDDRIAADYALSSEAELRYNAWLRRTRPADPLPEPHLVATPTAAMRTFLADLRDRHGGVLECLTGLGLPTDAVARLRAALLTGRPDHHRR